MKFSKEDLLLGFFVVLGISYPFIVAFLIFLQDWKEKRTEMEELRAFYSFLLGLEDCSREKAVELSELMSEDLSRSVGGAEGLLKSCEANRGIYGGAKAEESFVGSEYLVVRLTRKEKGITQRLASVRIRFRRGDEGLRIEGIDYEKGG